MIVLVLWEFVILFIIYVNYKIYMWKCSGRFIGKTYSCVSLVLFFIF